ncbi:hypothetical protein TNCV_4941111 [Trichonephila clavipes]|nr:hypothetical protein TNCV_4941111 [Trichonephila clavipes]
MVVSSSVVQNFIMPSIYSIALQSIIVEPRSSDEDDTYSCPPLTKLLYQANVKFNGHHPLYTAGLQKHQEANLRLGGHEFMSLTSR